MGSTSTVLVHPILTFPLLRPILTQSMTHFLQGPQSVHERNQKELKKEQEVELSTPHCTNTGLGSCNKQSERIRFVFCSKTRACSQRWK